MSPKFMAHLRGMLEEFGEEIAAKAVRRVLAEQTAPKFATAKSNPFGNKEKFLSACRKGAFPVKRVGRENWAEWSDVEAYIRGRQPPKRKAGSSLDGIDLDAMAEMATTPKRSRRAR